MMDASRKKSYLSGKSWNIVNVERNVVGIPRHNSLYIHSTQYA